ncbi:Origin of replication complex subunit 1A [Vitis vinifera]|uniref:Origin recognition complex subunit 1 n=1 Tax=Vitis vinifera TaxID=29760 RepID=A0A438FEE2_VITVI|nr:Origin of replication complex subunit 1A [Vitis vinifera]
MTETPQKSFHSPEKPINPLLQLPSSLKRRKPQLLVDPRAKSQAQIHQIFAVHLAGRKLPVTPDVSEARKRKRPDEGNVVTRARVSRNASLRPKKRVYYKKVVYEWGELRWAMMLFETSAEGGSRRDWICQFCEARKLGKEVVLPNPPKGRNGRELQGRSFFPYMEISGWYLLVSGHWYVIPEETAAGRQPHNLRTELYRTNDFADIEMESIIRLCNGMSPKEFTKANNEGDDIFLCEYEYDMHWHSFKCLAEIHNGEEGNEEADNGVDWDYGKDSGSDTEEDMEYEEENVNNLPSGPSPAHAVAATELERAKATLLLATLPKSLPCRTKEMEEITAFIKVAICNDRCLGPCLYIHGVPGTGKVIYEALSGHRVGWEKALHLLNERFADESKMPKRRSGLVLYNILDWPTKPHSKLIVNKVLESKYHGSSREVASPYFKPNGQAIEFASRKVTAISGDACRALEICRRAAELADYHIKKLASPPDSSSEDGTLPLFLASQTGLHFVEKYYPLVPKATVSSLDGSIFLFFPGKALVGMAEVEAAIQAMFQAPHIQVMKSSTKLSIVAMVYELYQTGMVETTFEKAMEKSSLDETHSESWVSHVKVLSYCLFAFTMDFFIWLFKEPDSCKLGECRIILCEAGATHRLQKLQLNFPSDDVAFALKDDKELAWLAKYL